MPMEAIEHGYGTIFQKGEIYPGVKLQNGFRKIKEAN